MKGEQYNLLADASMFFDFGVRGFWGVWISSNAVPLLDRNDFLTSPAFFTGSFSFVGPVETDLMVLPMFSAGKSEKKYNPR